MERVSLYSPETVHVDQAGLELRDPPLFWTGSHEAQDDLEFLIVHFPSFSAGMKGVYHHACLLSGHWGSKLRFMLGEQRFIHGANFPASLAHYVHVCERTRLPFCK